MVSEWPDKRDKTGFGSLARGGGDFFSRGHSPQTGFGDYTDLLWWNDINN